MHAVSFRRWPASAAVALGLQILAWIVAALGILQTLVFVVLALLSLLAGAGTDSHVGSATGFVGMLILLAIALVLLLPWAIAFLLLFAKAEELLIMDAIEENTRLTARNTGMMALAPQGARVP